MTSCILLPPGVGPGPRLAETSTRCAGAAALSWRACSSRRLWSAVPAGRRAQAPLAVAQDEDCDVVETREVYRASSSQREHKAGEPFLFAGSIATFTLGAALLAERLDGKGLIYKLNLDNTMHPVLVAAVLGLGLAAVWPHRSPPRQDSIVGMQRIAGRVSLAALAGALATEMATGQGALAALSVEVGMEELTEVETGLAFLLMLLLTGPRRT